LWWQKKQARRRVLEIEAKLVFPIPRIQRRCRPGHRRGKKTDDRRQSVWEGDADAVASTNTERCEIRRDSFDLIS
jgi:hypothetical protein